jgi:hypothetical protein
VRAITGSGCYEEFIVSTSDGVTIDTTPPDVTFTFQQRPVTSQEVVYQTAADKLKVLWTAEDPSGVNSTALLADVFDHDTEDATDVSGVLENELDFPEPRPASGESRTFGLRVVDSAGNFATYRFPHLTVDVTPPAFTALRCSPAVSALAPLVKCDWDTIDEAHSALAAIRVGVGSGQTFTDLLNFTALPFQALSWSRDVWDILDSLRPALTELYVIYKINNNAGLTNITSVRVINDLTPPTVDDVTVVTSPLPGFHDVKQRCQTTEDFIEVVMSLNDTESGIQRLGVFFLSQ